MVGIVICYVDLTNSILLAPFLVPQSPKQEMKRRKSIGNRDEDEYKGKQFPTCG